MGFDQRGADRAQVVGQPDPDPGLLARGGLAVPVERHGRGDRRILHAGVVMAVVGTVAVLRSLRHVLGLHQPLDDLDAALMADGDDAARDREILAPVRGARVDGAVDLVEPRLDGAGLDLDLAGPVVVAETLDLLQPGLQLPDLCTFLFGGVGGLGMDSPVAGGVLPRDADHGRDPFPPRRQFVGGLPEPVHGEPVQQHRVLEPGAGLVAACEEVAHDLPAGGLVGLRADESRYHRRAGHALLGQEPLHLPGGRAVPLGRDLLPDGQLAFPVGCYGEGLQHFQVDPVGPVGVQEFRRGAAEAEPLLDEPLGGAEPRRDGGDRLTGRGQLSEGLHLVGGMHGDADDVLGERDLAGIHVPGPDLAGHRMVGIDGAFPGQLLQGLEAAAPGDDGMGSGTVRVFRVGADDEVLQQSEGGN